MVSVVIPAFNEEAVIGRCLRALLEGSQPGELEIIVACNGCRDRTAERARSFGAPVTVIEVPVASKVAALNAADELARSFPRFYVDADVVLPLSSLRAIVAEMKDFGVLLASPVARTNTSASSLPVRMFYNVWLSLSYNRFMVGTGVYALSRIGRARFGDFPEVISDDGFVRSRFREEERVAVEAAPVYVTAPATLRALVPVKVRSRLGGYELAERYPSRVPRQRMSPRAILSSLPRCWALPWMLLVYFGINLLVRIKACVEFRRIASFEWSRDHSSRGSTGDHSRSIVS